MWSAVKTRAKTNNNNVEDNYYNKDNGYETRSDKKNNNYDLLYKKKLEIITGVSRPNLKYRSDNHDQYAKPEAYQEVTHSSLNYLDEVRLYR